MDDTIIETIGKARTERNASGEGELGHSEQKVPPKDKNPEMYKVVEFPETPRSAKRRIRSQSYTRTWKFGSKAQLKEREDPICNSRMRIPSGQDSAGLLPVQSHLSKEPTLNSNPSLSPRTEILSASAEIATRQHKDTNPESPTAGEVIYE